MKALIRLGLIMCLGLATLNIGCASMGDKDKTIKGTAIGTAAGALIGAGIGAARGDWAKGAMIGAGVGAAAGATTGIVMDRQEEALRKAGIRAERDQAGNMVISMAGESLKFVTGEAKLSSSGEATLTKLAGVLKQYPENRIIIEGHTDNVGKSTTNLALSQGRAERVKAFIISAGVPARCVLAATGFGSDKPAGDNKTAAGKAQNRRVDLKISVDEEEAKKNQDDREKYK